MNAHFITPRQFISSVVAKAELTPEVITHLRSPGYVIESLCFVLDQGGECTGEELVSHLTAEAAKPERLSVKSWRPIRTADAKTTVGRKTWWLLKELGSLVEVKIASTGKTPAAAAEGEATAEAPAPKAASVEELVEELLTV